MNQKNTIKTENTIIGQDNVTAAQELSPLPAAADAADGTDCRQEALRADRLKVILKKAATFALKTGLWCFKVCWFLIKGFFKLLWGSFKFYTCFNLARLK